MSGKITENPNFKTLIVAASLLAANAGYIASLSLAGLHSATVAHVTGDMARTGIYIVHGELFLFARMSLVWVSFMVGSSISAVIVSGTKVFDLRRTYGWAILLESFFLLISYLVSNRKAAVTGWWYSEYFGALACGIQNALCSSYSGNILRTTHMTGCCTDIGIVIGQEFRIRYYLPGRDKLMLRLANWKTISSYYQVSEAPPDAESAATTLSPVALTLTTAEPSILWKLQVLVPILVGFLLGAVIGGAMFMTYGNISLLVPALFTGALGFFFLIWTTVLKLRDRIKQFPPVQMIELSMVQMSSSLRSGFNSNLTSAQ